MKFVLYLVMAIYFSLSFIIFTVGVVDGGGISYYSTCRAKPTYIGYYTGLDFIYKLGCKAGKPMEEE